MPQFVLQAEHARLVKPTRLVETDSEIAGLSSWNTHLSPPSGRVLSPNEGLLPREPLPHLGTHPNTFPFRFHDEISGNGVLYVSNRPFTPSLEVREALMGFTVRETDILGLSTTQRF
jgi:hypothetical protein